MTSRRRPVGRRASSTSPCVRPRRETCTCREEAYRAVVTLPVLSGCSLRTTPMNRWGRTGRESAGDGDAPVLIGKPLDRMRVVRVRAKPPLVPAHRLLAPPANALVEATDKERRSGTDCDTDERKYLGDQAHLRPFASEAGAPHAQVAELWSSAARASGRRPVHFADGGGERPAHVEPPGRCDQQPRGQDPEPLGPECVGPLDVGFSAVGAGEVP
jgi:hypothetical protein